METSGEPDFVTRLRETLDPRFRLRALPAARVERIAAPVAIHAVDGQDETDAGSQPESPGPKRAKIGAA